MRELSANLEIKNLYKYFHGEAGAKLFVLEDINISNDFNKRLGSIVSILAPFGSGKSTLLKIISAIEKPSEGTVILNGKPYESSDGQVIYIPEKPSSFPWMSVKQNIQFSTSLNKNEITGIDDAISSVGLTGYEDHFPHEKSTGFRFRISVARALALKPILILLDDPLKNLHGETKKEILELLRNLKEKLNMNFMFSTTNITDAINLSDKIYLMKGHPGKIFKEIDLAKDKLSKNSPDFYNQVRTEIESAFSGFDGVPLISEIQ